MKVRLLAAVAVTMAVLLSCGDSRSPAPATPAPSAAMQKERLEFIQKLIDQGFFKKVETPGSLPHLWVTPKFMALDFDTKGTFVNVVYAYYLAKNPDYNLVVLYHSKTGKEVGQYAAAYGGLKLE
jgi:hypothetical protein